MGLFKGAWAGFVATIPMTLFMKKAHKHLPRSERYPLPPSTITARVEQKIGISEQLSRKEHKSLTMAAHFGYGTACGALYGLLFSRMKMLSPLKGSIFGVSVWAASYLGFLPKLGLSRSAVQMPFERNVLMVVAHLVWGSSLGILADQRSSSRRRRRG